MNWDLLILLNTSIFAILLGIIDYRSKLLPNKYVLFMILTNLGLICLAPDITLKSLFMTILLSFLIFLVYLLIFFISKQSFGLGDVKYSFALSIPSTYVFGFNQAWNMHLTGFILGGITAIGLMVFKKVPKNHAIAFGPFMSVSYFLFLVLNL